MSAPFLLVLMTLFAYRVYRLIGLDEITKRPRAWAVRRLPGQLNLFVGCPWCAGFWVSLLVVTVTAQITSVPLPVLQVGAVSTLVGLIGSQLDG